MQVAFQICKCFYEQREIIMNEVKKQSRFETALKERRQIEIEQSLEDLSR